MKKIIVLSAFIATFKMLAFAVFITNQSQYEAPYSIKRNTNTATTLRQNIQKMQNVKLVEEITKKLDEQNDDCPVFDYRKIDKQYPDINQTRGECSYYAMTNFLNLNFGERLPRGFSFFPEFFVWEMTDIQTASSIIFELRNISKELQTEYKRELQNDYGIYLKNEEDYFKLIQKLIHIKVASFLIGEENIKTTESKYYPIYESPQELNEISNTINFLGLILDDTNKDKVAVLLIAAENAAHDLEMYGYGLSEGSSCSSMIMLMKNISDKKICVVNSALRKDIFSIIDHKGHISPQSLSPYGRVFLEKVKKGDGKLIFDNSHAGRVLLSYFANDYLKRKCDFGGQEVSFVEPLMELSNLKNVASFDYLGIKNGNEEQMGSKLKEILKRKRPIILNVPADILGYDSRGGHATVIVGVEKEADKCNVFIKDSNLGRQYHKFELNDFLKKLDSVDRLVSFIYY